MILLIAIGGAMIFILIVLVISMAINKARIKNFYQAYNDLSIGMTENEVVNVLGSKYKKIIDNDVLSIEYTHPRYTIFEKDLLSKPDENITISINFSNGTATSLKIN